MSMKPGARTRPLPSISRVAVSLRRASTADMRLSRTATSTDRGAPPVPSITVAPRINKSSMRCSQANNRLERVWSLMPPVRVRAAVSLTSPDSRLSEAEGFAFTMRAPHRGSLLHLGRVALGCLPGLRRPILSGVGASETRGGSVGRHQRGCCRSLNPVPTWPSAGPETTT